MLHYALTILRFQEAPREEGLLGLEGGAPVTMAKVSQTKGRGHPSEILVKAMMSAVTL